MTDRTTITEANVGCWLDNHRGHYITRDMIELAIEFGYMVGPFEKYAIAHYDDWYSDSQDVSADGLYEGLVEIADEALAWLNCGDNEGPDREIKFQNNPPRIPKHYQWGWNDGDFGLYTGIVFNIYDVDKREKVAENLDPIEARAYLTSAGYQEQHIERFLDQDGDDIALQIGAFTVEAEYVEL